MEILGTELGPDKAYLAGQYEFGEESITDLRKKDHYLRVTEFEGNRKEVKEPLYLPPTKLEKTRLATLPQPPNLRFHYRYVAAELAWQAAKRLPDGTEELADVLNAAGDWIGRREEGHDLAQRFYDAIEKRCPQTSLGKKVLEGKWFSHEHGVLTKPLVGE